MLFFKKKKPNPTPSPDERRIQQVIEEGKIKHEMYNKLGLARKEYNINKDINKLIAAYEDVFVNNTPQIYVPDEFELALLYEKAGLRDKAWGYLNLLIMRGNTPGYLIYNEMANILKKEKRYVLAIDNYMECYKTKVGLLQDAWEDAFKKDVGICVRKLKWNEDVIEYLADLVKRHIQAGDLEYCNISGEFRKFYEDMK